MHAVYNYSGLVDIAEAVRKFKRSQAQAQTEKCSAESEVAPAEKAGRDRRTKSGRG